MKICITGDSWGCGEWDKINGKYQTSHLGTEFFLKEKYPNFEIINVSKGGSCNKEAINRLSEIDNVDCVIFFQTDPLRELEPYKSNKTYLDWKSYDDICSTQKNLAKDAYKKLDTYGVPVLMIGGCSKVYVDLIEQTKNLIPLIPSIAELLIPNFVQSTLCVDMWVNNIEIVFNDSKYLEDLNKIQKDVDNDKNALKQCAGYFYPDFSHANRKAHRVIANIVSDYINANLL